MADIELVIKIDEDIYKARQHWVANQKRTVDKVDIAIANGTPLDNVKAEIAEEICLTDNPYTKETKYTIEHSRLLEIFDNIGRAESEK